MNNAEQPKHPAVPAIEFMQPFLVVACGREPGSGQCVAGDGPETKAVFSRRNEREGNGRIARPLIEVDGLEPRAESRIGNLRLPFPEAGIQTTLNPKMIEEQLNFGGFAGKIAANVHRADLDAGQFASCTVRFDDHFLTRGRRLLPG